MRHSAASARHPSRTRQVSSRALDVIRSSAHTGSVPARLWGCYSVRDHLEPRAFVADLLLYDRLVVPVPAQEDVGRWEHLGWDPDRQQQLLDTAEPFVERVEWRQDLRVEFSERFSAALSAEEIGSIGRRAAGVSGWELTRRMISDEIRGDVLDDAPDGDIRAVSVYAEADRFDSEWSVDAVFPFIHRSSVVAPGRLREVREPSNAALEELAQTVVTKLVVPDDGQDDVEVLRKTVTLLERGDVSARRSEFQAVLAEFYSKGLKDETIIDEIDDLLIAYNEKIRKHSDATKARAVLQVATFAEAAVALWLPPVALAVGPTTAAGEALIRRHYGDVPSFKAGAVSLLAEARSALAP